MKWIDWCLFVASQVFAVVLSQSGFPAFFKTVAFVLLFPSSLAIWLIGEPLAHAVMKDQFHESLGVTCLLLMNALFWVTTASVVRKFRLRSQNEN